MKFKVIAGSPCRVILPDHDEVDFITTQENIFEENEVAFDPTFQLGVSVGPAIYGFERDGFVLVVESHLVEILNS